MEELLRYAEEGLPWARENGQRVTETHGLAQGLGRSYALLGDFAAAREAVAQGRAIAESLGFVWHRAGVASAAGFVELMAGDAEAAERELLEGCELVGRSGMTGSYFGVGLRDKLAEVLYVQGRYAEAKELSEASERCRAGLRPNPRAVARRPGQGSGTRGPVRGGETLARQAVGLAEKTELMLVPANAQRDLAEVLALSGRPDDAAGAARAALALYERKGDRVSARRMRAGWPSSRQEYPRPQRPGRESCSTTSRSTCATWRGRRPTSSGRWRRSRTRLGWEVGEHVGFRSPDGEFDFWISQRGEPSASHVGFRAADRAAVDAYYEAALAAGELTTAHRGCARRSTRATSRASCSTRRGTTWRPSATSRPEAAGKGGGMSRYLASGDWRVKEGREDEFVQRWTAWIEASVREVAGFRSARLARDAGDPRHFVSFSEWDDEQSRSRWKESGEFAEGMARVRELCDDFYGGDYAR